MRDGLAGLLAALQEAKHAGLGGIGATEGAIAVVAKAVEAATAAATTPEPAVPPACAGTSKLPINAPGFSNTGPLVTTKQQTSIELYMYKLQHKSLPAMAKQHQSLAALSIKLFDKMRTANERKVLLAYEDHGACMTMVGLCRLNQVDP